MPFAVVAREPKMVWVGDKAKPKPTDHWEDERMKSCCFSKDGMRCPNPAAGPPLKDPKNPGQLFPVCPRHREQASLLLQDPERVSTVSEMKPR